jgi:hypothetical protein
MFSFPDVTIDGSLIDLASCIHADEPVSPFEGDGPTEKVEDEDEDEDKDNKQLGTPEFPVLKCSAAVKNRTGPTSEGKRLPASDRLTEMPPDFCLDEEEKKIYAGEANTWSGEAEAMTVPL